MKRIRDSAALRRCILLKWVAIQGGIPQLSLRLGLNSWVKMTAAQSIIFSVLSKTSYTFRCR